MSEADQNIAALLSEERVFEPPRGVRRGGGPGPVDLRACRRRPRGVLGGARTGWLGQALGRRDDLGSPWVRWFDGGQLNAAYNCLDRPSRPAAATRSPTTGRARRRAGHHVPEPRRGLPVRERPQGTRRAQGRSSRDLPRHDPRAPGRDARVRSDRGAALGRLRRFPLRGPPRSHQRRRGRSDHRRRRYRRGAVVPLKANADEAVRECPTIEHVVTVRRTGGEHAFNEGRDLWYHDVVEGHDRVRARAAGRRAPAVPALHERDHREAEGHRAHDRRLPGGSDEGCRIFDIHEDDVLVRGGHRVVTKHSYIVYAPLANHTTSIIYEGAGHSARIDGGRSPLPGDDPVYGAHRHPLIHAVGHALSRHARSVVAGCSAP